MSYIRNCHIVLLVFDNNPESFKELKDIWFKFYKDNSNNDKSKFIVIANKSDQFGVNREQILQLGKSFSDEIDAFFISCSAKNADNIDNVENIVEKEAKRIINEEEEISNLNTSNYNNNSRFILENNQVNNKSDGRCWSWSCHI